MLDAKEKCEARLVEKKALLNTIVAQYTEIKAALQDKKTRRIDEEEKLKKLTKDATEMVQKAASWQRQLQDVRKKHEHEQREFNREIAKILATAKAPRPVAQDSAGGGGPTASTAMETVDGAADGGATTQRGSSRASAKAMSSEPEQEEEEEVEQLPVLSPEQLEVYMNDPDFADETNRTIGVLEAEKNKMKDVDMQALMNYLKKDAVYRMRLCELEEVTEVRDYHRCCVLSSYSRIPYPGADFVGPSMRLWDSFASV